MISPAQAELARRADGAPDPGKADAEEGGQRLRHILWVAGLMGICSAVFDAGEPDLGVAKLAAS